jgi:hypothetical protein
MSVQRKSPRLLDRVVDLLAAAQHDFPKPDIQVVLMGRNPDQKFAALSFYVSHADRGVGALLLVGTITCTKRKKYGVEASRSNILS